MLCIRSVQSKVPSWMITISNESGAVHIARQERPRHRNAVEGEETADGDDTIAAFAHPEWIDCTRITSIRGP